MSAPDQATIEEATRFGGFVLPLGARVLAAANEGATDQLWRLVLAVEPAAIVPLLTASDFAPPLRPGRRVFIPPLDGFDPSGSTDFASASEERKSIGERTVTREVLVDNTGSPLPLVHLWAYTT